VAGPLLALRRLQTTGFEWAGGQASSHGQETAASSRGWRLDALRPVLEQVELAIRAALGSGRAQLVRHLLAEALVLAALGGALAVLAAPWVYQVSTTDPATLIATAAALLASAVLASWVPARRATRVDPAVSLRAE